MSTNVRGDARHAPQLIPGAYDATTLTHRQSGSMGGPAFGSANVAIGPSLMDAATIADREREGGGAPNQRRQPLQEVPHEHHDNRAERGRLREAPERVTAT